MHFSVPYLIATAVLNILIGLVVFMRDPRLLSSKSFGVLSVSVAVWCAGLVGFYQFTGVDQIELSVKVFYISALLMNSSLLVFTTAFLELKNKTVFALSALGTWFLMAVPIAVSNGFLFSVSAEGSSPDVSLVGPTYALYTLLVIGYYVITLGLLFMHIKRAEPQKRQQIRYILAGLLISGIFASYFNVLQPWLGNYNQVWSGPLFTASFVGLIAYAILKHKLFDIRAAASRAVGYLLSSAFIILLFTGAVFALSGSNLLANNLTTAQRAAYITIAIGVALVFQPLRKFFDKYTNKLFYRDGYDVQKLIDDLNKNLVSGVELNELLTKTALIVQDNLKASYVTFYIRPTSYFSERIIGARRNDSGFKQIDILQETAKNLDSKVFEYDPDTDDQNQKKLSKAMKANDIEVLVRLVSSLDYHLSGIGYIFIGPKRSGNSYSKKDLDLLRIVANELVIAIENALRFEEIEEFNVTLQNKIDDATKELRKSNEKLTALDEAKDEFISMASHQLRTPLTSVKGYISMVLEGDTGKINPQQAKMLDQAFISSQRMVYLIADLLNVSRLRTGKFAIEAHPTQLADVVESEISQLQGAAEARGLKLKYTKPKNFPELMLDETKIRQVIMNFIDNALYYTPKGSVTVYLKTTKTSVEFGVTDTGMGVPKKEVPHLFTKFYRAGNARQARPDGTGLGLFMAKKVIVASGGSLLFKTKEGKGSTFGFIFPLKKLQVEDKSKA